MYACLLAQYVCLWAFMLGERESRLGSNQFTWFIESEGSWNIHAFYLFFFLLLFFSRSFVAGVKKPFWHSALLFFVCIICGMLLSLFASFKLKVFPRMYAVANLVRLWQTINPMSRMPCRQKYINKFCLYSAIFLLFLVSFFSFAFYTLFSLHSGKHTGNDLCEPQANTHLIHHSF